MAAPKKVTNVPEVDAAKRRESDLKAQEAYAAELIADLEAKKAEYEAEMQKQLAKYMEPDPELLPKRAVRPVHKPTDYTEIPDVAYESTSPSTVKWRKDPNEKYRLVRYKGSTPRVASARAKGWKPLFWADSFKGTDFFENTVEGYVLIGDCIIMHMSQREFKERIVDQLAALREARARGYEDMFAQTGDELSRSTGQKIDVFRHDGSKGGDSNIEIIN